MQFKTSKFVYGFTAMSVACAALGGVAQVTKNLDANQAESGRNKNLTVVAQEYASNTCRAVKGGQFQIGEVIQEEVGQAPTGCYTNDVGEFGFAARQNGQMKVLRVFSNKQVKSRLSEINKPKGEKK